MTAPPIAPSVGSVLPAIRGVYRRPNVRFGSIAPEIRCPRHVRSLSLNDQIADIKQRRRGANSGFEHQLGIAQISSANFHLRTTSDVYYGGQKRTSTTFQLATSLGAADCVELWPQRHMVGRIEVLQIISIKMPGKSRHLDAS